jgi:hypothetical protein
MATTYKQFPNYFYIRSVCKTNNLKIIPVHIFCPLNLARCPGNNGQIKYETNMVAATGLRLHATPVPHDRTSKYKPHLATFYVEFLPQ